MARIKHAHTYERIKSRPDYYRCIHPDCSHFAHREFIKGKRSTCVCGNQFVLTLESLKLRRPHCEFCGKNPPSERISDEDILDVLAPELTRPKYTIDENILIESLKEKEE